MIFKILDKALTGSDNKAGLFLLNQAFRFGIPFNIPHAFQLKKLTLNQAIVGLPKIKTNTNHLGTIHACAIATAGEFVSGVLILKNLGATEVRLVLKTLNVDYQRQGTTKLNATVNIDEDNVKFIKHELEHKDKVFVNMVVELKDTNGQLVSVVSTEWQVKKWSAVTSKL